MDLHIWMPVLILCYCSTLTISKPGIVIPSNSVRQQQLAEVIEIDRPAGNFTTDPFTSQCPALACVTFCSIRGWRNRPCSSCMRCWGWLVVALQDKEVNSNDGSTVVYYKASSAKPRLLGIFKKDYVADAITQRTNWNLPTSQEPVSKKPVLVFNPVVYRNRPNQAPKRRGDNVNAYPPFLQNPMSESIQDISVSSDPVKPYEFPVKSAPRCPPPPVECASDPGSVCSKMRDERGCVTCKCQPKGEEFSRYPMKPYCPKEPKSCVAHPGEICNLSKNRQGCPVCKCRQRSKFDDDYYQQCPNAPDRCIEDPGEICSLQTNERGCRFCKCGPKSQPSKPLRNDFNDRKGKIQQCPPVTQLCIEPRNLNNNCTVRLSATGCPLCTCSLLDVEVSTPVRGKRPCPSVMCSQNCRVVRGEDGCERCECDSRSCRHETDCEARNCSTEINQDGCRRCDCSISSEHVLVCPEFVCPPNCRTNIDERGCAISCDCRPIATTCPIVEDCRDKRGEICDLVVAQNGCMKCSCEQRAPPTLCKNVTACSAPNCKQQIDGAGCPVCVCNTEQRYVNNDQCSEVFCASNCRTIKDSAGCPACLCSGGNEVEIARRVPCRKISCSSDCMQDIGKDGCPYCNCGPPTFP